MHNVEHTYRCNQPRATLLCMADCDCKCHRLSEREMRSIANEALLMQLGSVDDAIALVDDTFIGHYLDKEAIIEMIEEGRSE